MEIILRWINKLRPKYKNSDWQIRKEAVEEIKNKRILANIAKSDDNSNVRKAAVSLLTDWRLLIGIALKDTDDSVCLEAICRLHNLNHIHSLSEYISYSPIRPKRRTLIIQNIKDQLTLEDIIRRNEYDSEIRKEVLKQISDIDELFLLVSSGSWGLGIDYQKIIAKDMTEVKDDHVIYDVIMYSRNSIKSIPDILIKAIKDQSLLLSIVNEDKLSLTYRLTAIEKINDVYSLRDLAINHREKIEWVEKDLSKKATRTLSDMQNPEAVNMLIEIIKQSPYIVVVLEAITGLQKLNELPSSFKIISNELLIKLKKWHNPAFQYDLRGDVEDSRGEYYEENPTYIGVGKAIAWLEKEINKSET